MKKLEIHQYHIADILTACEVVCTCILGVLVFTGAPPEVALIIFGVGELCDAFDGICARKLKPYPNDGKYRWWRVYASQIEKITDVFHLSVMGIFFIFRICAKFTYFRPWIAFLVALIVALICIFVQVIITDAKDKQTKRIKRIIRGRRILYLACIATIVFGGLYAVAWPNSVRINIAVVLCIGALGLSYIKWDRLTNP